jgi:hypothetical protein
LHYNLIPFHLDDNTNKNLCISAKRTLKMSLKALSTEIQQSTLGYLDFISLLNIRNTNTIWRDLVSASLSKPNIILPTRVKLLELYLELHQYPSLLPSPDDIDPEEEIFSGTEYLSNLSAQITQYAPNANFRIPAEFEHWILEWPSCAPLSFTYFAELEEDYGERFLSSNDAGERLSWSSASEEMDLAGLYVRYHGCTVYTTLFFEAGKERDGMVWSGDICEMEEGEEWDEDENLAGCWRGVGRSG